MNAILARAIAAAKCARHTPRNIPIRASGKRVAIRVLQKRSRNLGLRFEPPIVALEPGAQKIKPLVPGSRVNKIIDVVASYYGLSAMELVSQRRLKSVAHARHVAMYLAKVLTPHSYPIIGRYFSDRDHTTIMAAFHKIDQMMLVNEQVRTDLEKLKRECLD